MPHQGKKQITERELSKAKEAIGRALANFRFKEEMTQDDAAELIGISKTHVFNVEQGDSDMKLSTLLNIANMQGKKASEFLSELGL